MQITDDKAADALYFRLIEGDYQCRVVQFSDDIDLEFAASQLFEQPENPVIALQDLILRLVVA